MVRKTGSIVHFPQQVGNFNHWIHIADLGIQFLGVERDGAQWLTEARQMLDFNLKRLAHRARLRKLEGVRLEAGTLIVTRIAGEVPAAAQSESILLLHCGECRPRHEMLVDWPEGSAAIDPNVRRSKPFRKAASVAIS